MKKDVDSAVFIEKYNVIKVKISSNIVFNISYGK